MDALKHLFGYNDICRDGQTNVEKYVLTKTYDPNTKNNITETVNHYAVTRTASVKSDVIGYLNYIDSYIPESPTVITHAIIVGQYLPGVAEYGIKESLSIYINKLHPVSGKSVSVSILSHVPKTPDELFDIVIAQITTKQKN